MKLPLLAAALALSVAACDSGPYILTAQEKDTAELSGRRSADQYHADFSHILTQDSDKDGNVTGVFKNRKTGEYVEYLCPYKAQGFCKSKPPSTKI